MPTRLTIRLSGEPRDLDDALYIVKPDLNKLNLREAEDRIVRSKPFNPSTDFDPLLVRGFDAVYLENDARLPTLQIAEFVLAITLSLPNRGVWLEFDQIADTNVLLPDRSHVWF